MRSIARKVVAALALVAAPSLATAAQNCAALDTTQAGLNECYRAEAQAKDRELNRRYRDLLARLKDAPDRAGLLQAAQRAWVTFRDAECGFARSGVAGGSAEPMVDSQCLADMTAKRNAELKLYAECGEGDLACPVPPAR